ncbi:MAG: hypothetical protein AB7U35_06845 [Sphingobium sp.]
MAAMPGVLPIQRVLLGAAGQDSGRAAWVFHLDNECAHIARVTKEPIMAQVRLAWWRDALAGPDLRPEQHTEATVALRALEGFALMRPHLLAMIDGWEELAAWNGENRGAMLDAYSGGRGGGLFSALVPESAGEAAVAGRIWALWDLAGHMADDILASEALAFARRRAEVADHPVLPRMVAMMAIVARADVLRGRAAPANLTPGLYLRLLRAQFFER